MVIDCQSGFYYVLLRVIQLLLHVDRTIAYCVVAGLKW
jgi:hypothetical protein